MTKAALAALMLMLLTGASAYWYQRDSAPDLPPLRTAPVERGNLAFTINATGTVEPEEVVDVGAQVAGKIESLGADPRYTSHVIDYGSPVDVGTVLAIIDDSLYQSEVAQAQAQVASADALTKSTAAQVVDAKANVDRSKKDLQQLQAKLLQSDRDWRRAQNLWNTSRDALSEAEYDLARFTYEAADAAVGVGTAAIAQATAQVSVAEAAVAKSRADLAQAQATLDRAQTNLGYCTVKSPVTGVIIDRRINVGQTVVSSLNSPSLFLIAKDLKRLQVWASVNEADIGHIKSGQAVQFTVDAFPGEMFPGKVAPDQPRLNASMTQNVVTYTVVVETDNSSGKLIPYLTADVEFDVALHENVLLVPNAALRWHPSPERLAAAGLSDSVGGENPAGPSAKKAAASADASGKEGTLWVEDNGRLRPVIIRQVLSDDTHTEVVADDLHEGDHVVVGETFTVSASGSTDPFSPKMFGNRRTQQ